MKMEIGRIVLSTAGKDKGRYFCVVELGDDCCFLRDGKLHKLENPKKKSLKHLKITPNILRSEALQVNKHLKKAIDSLMKF